jgi:hypothetical protein
MTIATKTSTEIPVILGLDSIAARSDKGMSCPNMRGIVRTDIKRSASET